MPPAACLKERAEIAAVDQDRTLPADHRKALLDPLPNGIPVEAEEAGDLVHRVTAMDFRKPRIRTAAHWFALRRLILTLASFTMLHGATSCACNQARNAATTISRRLPSLRLLNSPELIAA
jgi:hypothetical protein